MEQLDNISLFQQRLELLKEAEQAANNYKKTGLHCTHEEVKLWLQNLANGNIMEQPKCHK